MENIEVRRLKTKLKLFEEEGFNWVVADIFDDLINQIYLKEEDKAAGKLVYAANLKKKYQEKLQELSPKDNKQGKLDI